jgi:hypothetical protein
MANFQRIRQGMSIAEVESVLGKRADIAYPPGTTNCVTGWGRIWVGRQVAIWINFDPHGAVAHRKVLAPLPSLEINGYRINPSGLVEQTVP